MDGVTQGPNAQEHGHDYFVSGTGGTLERIGHELYIAVREQKGRARATCRKLLVITPNFPDGFLDVYGARLTACPTLLSQAGEWF